MDVKLRQHISERQVQVIQKPLPARRHGVQHCKGMPAAIFEGFCDRQAIVAAAVELRLRQRPVKQFAKLDQQTQFVARGKLDVDALDRVGVLAHAPKRDDHILVDLERIGVAGDRGSARTVEPEFLARIGTHGDETLAMAGVRQTHDFARGGGNGGLVIADDIANQHHLGQHAPLALGRIADRAQVALVQMFEPGEQRATRPPGTFQVVLDLDDRRDRVARLTKKLQADRAGMARHTMKHPARGGDQAITPFFLDAGQAREKLIGDILAQPGLAQAGPIDFEDSAADQMLPGRARAVKPLELEAHWAGFMNLAQVVIQTGDLKPVAVRIHHAPPGKVVQGGTPEHGLLAAGVHGHIATHARRLGRRRIDREHKTSLLSGLGHPFGDHARTRQHRSDGGRHARQRTHFDRTKLIELFGIDDGRLPGQGNRAARVARATTTRDDGQPELNATPHQAGDLLLGIRGQNDQGILDAPVSGVGDMGNAGQAVKLDVVLCGQPTEDADDAPAQLRGLVEQIFEGGDRGMRPAQQASNLFVTVRVIGHPPLVDLGQAVAQRFDQQTTALRVVKQIVLQIGIALNHPDIAQNLVEHLGGATGAALAPQVRQQTPRVIAQKAADHLTIGKRGVVVGNLAQARVRLRRHGRSEKMTG